MWFVCPSLLTHVGFFGDARPLLANYDSLYIVRFKAPKFQTECALFFTECNISLALATRIFLDTVFCCCAFCFSLAFWLPPSCLFDTCHVRLLQKWGLTAERREWGREMREHWLSFMREYLINSMFCSSLYNCDWYGIWDFSEANKSTHERIRQQERG